MLKLLLGAAAITAFGALDSVAAAERDYAFCLMGGDFGARDCIFDTYPQCQASASGRDAWCAANPYFHQSRDPQPARSNAHHAMTRRRL